MMTLVGLIVTLISAGLLIGIVLAAERAAGMIIGAIKDRGEYHSED